MEKRELFEGKRIGVIMGGTSGEREVSLRSGEKVHESLVSQGFDAIALDVKDDAVEVISDGGFDIAFVILHGRGGEDGTIQGVLEQLGIPYTGSRVLASALSMDKVFSKRIFLQAGIPTPEHLVIEKKWDIGKALEEAEGLLRYPMVLKPVNEGSSLGVVIVHDREEFVESFGSGTDRYEGLFIEQFIQGKCVTVGILGTGDDARPLPTLELIPSREFYDYEAKYTSGLTEFVCPAVLEERVYEETQIIATRTHRILGLEGFSRVDLQVDTHGKPYVLEANSIPGMTELSDLPAEAKACGMNYDELVFEILKSALEKHF